MVAAGQEYKDTRYEFAEWPAVKPTTPRGQLPILKVQNDDGSEFVLTESMAIGNLLSLMNQILAFRIVCATVNVDTLR